MVPGDIAAGASALAPAAGGPCTVPSAKATAFKFCLMADAGDSQVRLTWTPLGEDFTIYDGTIPGTGKPVKVSTATAKSALVTGLTNGTRYYFWLVVNEIVMSNTASAIPVTVPGTPAGLTATPGNAQVTLSWTAPASDGGSPVTGYDLYAGTTADFHARDPIAKVTGTVVMVTGLVNGTTYYFSVTAVNQVGEGSAAEAPAIPVTVPGTPAGLTAIPGNGKVTLSWAAPASDGGSPVISYIIYQGTSPGGETGAPVSGSLVTATSYTVTGLTNGTTYYFRLVAVNAVGLSPLSAEASATLPIIVPPSTPASSATTSTRPASSATTPTGTTVASASTSAPAFAAPTGLTATAGNTQVRLSWTPPASDGGSPVISYKVYMATAPGAQGSTVIGTGKGTGGTVTGLVNGTVYYFMVTAVNAAGNESPFSTGVSSEPTGPARGVTVSLTSTTVPKQLIGLLMAVAGAAAFGALTLIARRRRRFRSRDLDRLARGGARSGGQMAVASDVRAVPDTGRPDVVSVRDTGREPTHTIRFQPNPGVATTTIKERRP